MSCLFDSLSKYLKEDSKIIRCKVCKYLEQNNSIMEDIETKIILNMDRDNYIESMTDENTWGGGIEIKAACNIWNIKIKVIYISNISKSYTIEFIPSQRNKQNRKKNRVIKLYYDGVHYKSTLI
jgi:hypothetical protein